MPTTIPVVLLDSLKTSDVPGLPLGPEAVGLAAKETEIQYDHYKCTKLAIFYILSLLVQLDLW